MNNTNLISDRIVHKWKWIFYITLKGIKNTLRDEKSLNHLQTSKTLIESYARVGRKPAHSAYMRIPIEVET